MANIMDYLLWRGDLDWDAAEFNEVDNLILSELIYVDFSEFVPGPGEGDVGIADVSHAFFEKHTDEEINEHISSTKVSAFLMREMAKTKRFAGIRLADYVNDISTEEQSQFCAMTVDLGDGRLNVVYSGTDATIVGWRENFNMSFLSETPGQLKAVEYLSRVAAKNSRPLRIMGHSKGGNLSVYAATHADPGIMERIEVIYSNDGPGFSETMISAENYKRMLPKIHTIVPESSIVGMLLEHEEEFEVVKSSGSGAGQHDVMSWEVLGPSLVHCSTVDEKAVILDRTLKSWLASMDSGQREELVDALFSVLEEGDIRTVDDLAAMHPGRLLELIKNSRRPDRDGQEILWENARRLAEEGGRVMQELLFGREK
ncbi:MAG: DUF2974 domain-containing protein [Blautia sp.]|nr:DUF2974 domain-containing protein [Blautia sp.]